MVDREIAQQLPEECDDTDQVNQHREIDSDLSEDEDEDECRVCRGPAEDG